MGKASRLRGKEESRRRSPKATILDVPDELLELVLLRVRTPVSLLRAAATCKPWRRLVAGTGFLRRFRALNRPHLHLGHYCVHTVVTEDYDVIRRPHGDAAVFLPSPAPRPPELLRRRLSLDFLPRPPKPTTFPYSDRHVLTDSRGGLLALAGDNLYAIVCNPWSKQYRELSFPWVHERPRGGGNIMEYWRYHTLGAFFLNAGEGDMSSFKVLCAWLTMGSIDCTITAHACVYSARDRRWLQPSTSMNVGRQHWTPGGWGSRDPHDTCDGFMGRAGGFVLWHCLYGHVLVLDETTLEFSTFRLPPTRPDVDEVYMPRQPIYDGRDVRVVAGGEAATGSLRIVRVVDDGDLEVLVRIHGAGECTVERKVGLCELAGIDATPDWSWGFLDVAMASSMDLVLSAFSRSTRTMEYYFSFDVENMKLQRMKKRMPFSSQWMFPYELPWPPTINACL